MTFHCCVEGADQDRRLAKVRAVIMAVGRTDQMDPLGSDLCSVVNSMHDCCLTCKGNVEIQPVLVDYFLCEQASLHVHGRKEVNKN